jgi:hypothetical protein
MGNSLRPYTPLWMCLGRGSMFWFRIMGKVSARIAKLTGRGGSAGSGIADDRDSTFAPGDGRYSNGILGLPGYQARSQASCPISDLDGGRHDERYRKVSLQRRVWLICREDSWRWCEYIAFRGLWRVGYARVHESDITDTELQVCRVGVLADCRSASSYFPRRGPR